jgi:hypothetical protein
MSHDKQLIDIAVEFNNNPCLAHRVIFPHRHSAKTSAAHDELIRLFHDQSVQNVIGLCFRGFGKSTLAEETVVLEAASGLVKNVIVLGESYTRACERLRSIRRELENNEWIAAIYGPQMGDTWSESKLVLANGTAITAQGQGMALRGMKHDTSRPDLIFIDDLESEETVGTPAAREKLSDWFYKDLMPVNMRARKLITATPLDPEALVVKLSKDPAYKTLKVPIDYIDENGVRQATWPEQFPLEIIDDLEDKFRRAGKQAAFAQEYRVQAVDPATKLFRHSMFKCDPSLKHTWEPVYIVYDPARTNKTTSATTGYVVASWVGRKLIIWEAGGERWMPSEMIEHMFAMERKYEPIVIGVEKDGLSEWIEEPIRQEQIKRSLVIPVKAIKAPRDKLNFIQSLQPLMVSGSIVFAGDPGDQWVVDTINQFLSYPSGAIDVPNAMAYLLNDQVKQGTPVYDDASQAHIAEHLALRPGPVLLGVNASAFGSTAILCQYKNSILTILNSWALPGDAGQTMRPILEEAQLYAGRSLTVSAPPDNFDTRNSLGLRAALRGLAELRRGGDAVRGREVIRGLFRSEVAGAARLLIGPDATWARRAIFGGYARLDGKVDPAPGLYATLMEGLESIMAGVSQQSEDTQQMIAVDPRSGMRYQTAALERGRR